MTKPKVSIQEKQQRVAELQGRLTMLFEMSHETQVELRDLQRDLANNGVITSLGETHV